MVKGKSCAFQFYFYSHFLLLPLNSWIIYSKSIPMNVFSKRSY